MADKNKLKAVRLERRQFRTRKNIFGSPERPRLSVFRITTPDDKDEADTIWSYDMMKQLGTSQHNMCAAMMCCTSTMGNPPGRVARRRS